MRTVTDGSGTRYLLLEQSRDSWLVRDPLTGEERHLAAEECTVVTGHSPLATAAAAVPDAVRDDLASPSDRALGLLAEIHAREPVGVRTLLADYDLCESDLHGLLGEFVAAALIAETTVAGERAYESTPRLAALLADGG